MNETASIGTNTSTPVEADLTAPHGNTETPSGPEHRSSHQSTSPQLGGLSSRPGFNNNALLHKTEDVGNAGNQLSGTANHVMNSNMEAMMQMQMEAAQRSMAVKLIETTIEFQKDLVGSVSKASQKIQ
ncbi:hypothetical protein AB1286_26840 [Trinickia sp. NRRL B-1857]|uniref:hypothetical protein n=1 Tax=Trinickia sp. NRRL B-1857 TaxID=3162879 RepID=UPI003D287150